MFKLKGTPFLIIALSIFLTSCAVGSTTIKRGGFETRLDENTRLNIKPSGKVFFTFRVTD
jgi:hypothetical protein